MSEGIADFRLAIADLKQAFERQIGTLAIENRKCIGGTDEI
jgi:hypothetical protein